MVLHAHSDASYLSAPRARSRAGGFFYLSNENLDNHHLNGPIHVEAKIMKNVVASAAEAELSALFLNTQLVVPLQTTLTEMGHIQPPTPIQVDSLVAYGFSHMPFNIHSILVSVSLDRYGGITGNLAPYPPLSTFWQ